ncbi:Reverse transcriptase (RNA-dependent DNA polymerase) [Fructobacillus sp. EFB-N1]|nr:Reverse transcriptase (RNA-dependent DNA polymerase) [Fructobacillus sp. EFB-N1]
MAGEKGKSTLKNAHKHLKNNQILKLDMSNFYPNCTREYIYSFFNKKMQCSPDVSELLCNLLLYNNGLCQGSSPSMVLSFFAYQDMFFEINKIVSERGLIMTTWVDDITISGPDNFNNKR